MSKSKEGKEGRIVGMCKGADFYLQHGVFEVLAQKERVASGNTHACG